MPKLNTRTLLFGGIGLFALIIILVVARVIPGLKKSDTPPLSGTVVIWTVGEGDKDEKAAWEDILRDFKGTYPDVKVTRRDFDSPESYESSLLEGLATGEGPDVFMVLNHAAPRYANKISPAPEMLYPLSRLRSDFPKVVEQDFAPQGKIYGVPLSVDTLSLIYNRSALDQAAVSVPQSWEDFSSALQALTKSDASGISYSGAALGTAGNVPYAADTLSLLMLQSGTKMTNAEFTDATFDSKEGAGALEFYTQFADAGSTAYTWNNSLPSALDSFSQEKVAMLLGYAETARLLREKSPFLDIGVAEAPQSAEQIARGKKVSYPRYYGFAVSRQSKSPDVAWQFLISSVASQESAGKYLITTKKPPALRALLVLNKDDAQIGAFARQALIAVSWPQVDNALVVRLFSTAITDVNEGRETPVAALKKAADEISRAMQKKF